MKKLKRPLRGYHAFLLFLLSMFISAFSFSQTTTGQLYGENNKPPAGATVTIKETRRSVTTGNDGSLLSTPKAQTIKSSAIPGLPPGRLL